MTSAEVTALKLLITKSFKVVPGGATGPVNGTRSRDVITVLNALVDAIAAADGAVTAPQWVAGKQTAFSLVFDNGLIYLVRTNLTNGTLRPANYPDGYLAIGPGGAGGPTQDYISTENLGGIRAGDTFTTADPTFVQLLVRYQAPGFASFTVANAGTRTVPVGTPFSAGFKSFAWSTSNIDNVRANSITLRDVTANTILASNEANDGSASVSTAAFTATLGLSRTYLIAGVNSNGDTFFSDVSIYGETESYLGLSTAQSLTGPQLVALGSPQLQGSRGRTASGVTATGGNYLYYAYDARHGDLTSIILDGAAPVLGAFRKLGDVATTNATGASVTLRVYRSNATNAFSNNSLAFA